MTTIFGRLNAIEKRAIEAAATATCAQAVEAVLNALWDAGVRSLEDVRAAHIAAAEDALRASDGPFFAFLDAYSSSVQAQIENHEPPF